MKRRRIGNTDLKVSPICLGTMTFGRPVEKKEAIRIVHFAIDSGVNFIDTANMYEGYDRYIGSPGGVAEEILGEALKGKRDKVILTTKVGMVVGPGKYDRGLSRKHVEREIEKSLRRLKTDYVDIYLMHKPDPETPLEETLEVFNDLVKKGKVRYFGVSNHSTQQIKKIIEMCKSQEWGRITVNQPHHSLLDRSAEKEQFPLCIKENIGITPYRIFDGGWLTGKYTSLKQAPENSRLKEKPDWMSGITEETFEKILRVRRMAEEVGKPLSQYVISWELTRSAVASVILGVKRTEQLEDAISVMEWTFPEEHLSLIDRIFPLS